MTTSPLSPAFLSKKAQILELLAIPDEDYTDKSPKGSVDAPIIDLIREINKIDGLVTTSSCSGRVSVFVEGPQNKLPNPAQDDGNGDSDDEGDMDDPDLLTTKTRTEKKKKIRGGPSGKGGGKWLFVSHDPLDLPSLFHDTSTERNDKEGRKEEYFTKICGLQRLSSAKSQSAPKSKAQPPSPENNPKEYPKQIPRLIHLSFSPLILHVLTANLSSHARPLLSAAINAGFRESGVQSLSALQSQSHPNSNPNSTSQDKTNPGTMVAIRTAGLSFDTVIGVVRPSLSSSSSSRHEQNGHRVNVDEDDDEKKEEEEEIMEAIVSEEYLAMCFAVINERFRWNEGRKERLRAEINWGFFGKEKGKKWEEKEERRRRKREEGLRRRGEIETRKKEEDGDGDGKDEGGVMGDVDGDDALDGVLDLK